MRSVFWVTNTLLAALSVWSAAPAQGRVEILRPVGGLAATVCDALHEPIAFVQATDGRYFLLDRRAHTIYSVDRTGTRLTKVMEAGMQKARSCSRRC